MSRAPNLRQIEAFKAVVESGSASAAAVALGISQPAVSKLLAYLEADSGLDLFERKRGRLVPTESGLRLYNEVDRIFAGIKQVEGAIEAIRREEGQQLIVGVMPAFAGRFIGTVVARFLSRRPNVRVSVLGDSSRDITDGVAARKVDVGIVSWRGVHPGTIVEPIMEMPAVCVMPKDHPLARLKVVTPADLDGVPFVISASGGKDNKRIEALLTEKGARPDFRVDTTVVSATCELVAEGLGIAIMHPVHISPVRDRVTVRPFAPEILLTYYVYRPAEARNRGLVNQFVEEAIAAAEATALTTLTGNERSFLVDAG